jgi:hypothetical protein
MDVETSKSKECCGVSDLLGQKTGILLWWLPTVALAVGLNWTGLRLWLWIPAFLIMGVGCLVNASRCGRLHCYICGPVFVLAAIYVALAAANVVPMHPEAFLLTLCAIAMLACLAELPFGRYRKRA